MDGPNKGDLYNLFVCDDDDMILMVFVMMRRGKESNIRVKGPFF